MERSHKTPHFLSLFHVFRTKYYHFIVYTAIFNAIYHLSRHHAAAGTMSHTAALPENLPDTLCPAFRPLP